LPTVVVDASAIGAILFAEPDGEQILRAIAGFDLTAPALIRHEIISTAIKKHRARPEDRMACLDGLRRFAGPRIRERAIVPSAVLALALDTGLTAYDVSYLWLARDLDVPLITLDYKLARAYEATA
jgi:predicted nucleic acid-binding protein